MRILLISDIHANFPALQAVINYFKKNNGFDLVLNGGDTMVYGPFPNQTIDWLREQQVLSILGNTDHHVIKLLNGKTFKKPGKAEKRIMYGWTAAELSSVNRSWLISQPDARTVSQQLFNPELRQDYSLSMFHGSPADREEFLFFNTPMCRLEELASLVSTNIVTVGHSHQQFHHQKNGIHFINPGSVGRMFDGKVKAGCAVVTLTKDMVEVELHRISYPVEEVVTELRRLHFPSIYVEMYRQGRKLN